jgi:hypothetical protein
MTKTGRWQDAFVGTETPQIAVRVTPEEKVRLEELRRHYRLTSKAQVVRMALDALEALSAPATLFFDGEKGLKENQEVVELLKSRLEAHGFTSFGELLRGPGADGSGMPGPAEPGQLELPEMPSPVDTPVASTDVREEGVTH